MEDFFDEHEGRLGDALVVRYGNESQAHWRTKEAIVNKISQLIHNPTNAFPCIHGAVCVGCGAPVSIAILPTTLQAWHDAGVWAVTEQRPIGTTCRPDVAVCDPISGHVSLAIEVCVSHPCLSTKLFELATTTDGVLEIWWKPFMERGILSLKSPLIMVPSAHQKTPPLCDNPRCQSAWGALPKETPWPVQVASAFDQTRRTLIADGWGPNVIPQGRLLLWCMRDQLRHGSPSGHQLAPLAHKKSRSPPTPTPAEVDLRRLFTPTQAAALAARSASESPPNCVTHPITNHTPESLLDALRPKPPSRVGTHGCRSLTQAMRRWLTGKHYNRFLLTRLPSNVLATLAAEWNCSTVQIHRAYLNAIAYDILHDAHP